LTRKAGIITFHNAENYGAALQTYALMRTLQKLGCECEVIDYRNRGVFKRNAIKNLYYGVTLQHPLKNHRLFRSFQNNDLNLSQRSYRSVSEFEIDAGKFDVLFFGSDQIWNPDLANGFDPFYFGHFATPAKKIAYAASAGKDQLSLQERDTINQLIGNLDAVSVREETLLPLIDRDVISVLDPCMLLSRESWDQIAGKKTLQGNYILVYQLFPNQHILQTARQYAGQSGLQIALISPYLSCGGGIRKLGRISPNDFLAYYRDAHLVLSDSFHGTIFSILYQKPFYTLLPAEKTGRITSLLDKLDLSNRIIHHPNVTPPEVDYTRVNLLLEREVERSLAFIRKQLA